MAHTLPYQPRLPPLCHHSISTRQAGCTLRGCLFQPGKTKKKAGNRSTQASASAVFSGPWGRKDAEDPLGKSSETIAFIGAEGKELFSLPTEELVSIKTALRMCARANVCQALMEASVAGTRMWKLQKWVALGDMTNVVNLCVIAWLLWECQASVYVHSESPPTDEAVDIYDSDDEVRPSSGATINESCLMNALASIGKVFQEMSIYAMVLAIVQVATSATEWTGTLPVVAVISSVSTVLRLLYSRHRWARQAWRSFLQFIVQDESAPNAADDTLPGSIVEQKVDGLLEDDETDGAWGHTKDGGVLAFQFASGSGKCVNATYTGSVATFSSSATASDPSSEYEFDREQELVIQGLVSQLAQAGIAFVVLAVSTLVLFCASVADFSVSTLVNRIFGFLDDAASAVLVWRSGRSFQRILSTSGSDVSNFRTALFGGSGLSALFRNVGNIAIGVTIAQGIHVSFLLFGQGLSGYLQEGLKHVVGVFDPSMNVTGQRWEEILDLVSGTLLNLVTK